MLKNRILAIIGIVLPIICFWFLASYYDSDSGKYIPTAIHTDAEPYPAELQHQIWIQQLKAISVLVAYQLFYCITSLIKGVKDKIKSFRVLSIIGMALSVCFLFTGIGGNGFAFSIIHIPYSIAFSIIMLVRSFRR